MEVTDFVLAESGYSLSSEELVNVTCRAKSDYSNQTLVDGTCTRARADILLLVTNKFSTKDLSKGVNTPCSWNITPICYILYAV